MPKQAPGTLRASTIERREKIRKRLARPGPVPTDSELATEFNIDRSTVREDRLALRKEVPEEAIAEMPKHVFEAFDQAENYIHAAASLAIKKNDPGGLNLAGARLAELQNQRITCAWKLGLWNHAQAGTSMEPVETVIAMMVKQLPAIEGRDRQRAFIRAAQGGVN